MEWAGALSSRSLLSERAGLRSEESVVSSMCASILYRSRSLSPIPARKKLAKLPASAKQK